ncbi:MAG: hypothetical protein AAF596_06100, partial [Planctomycetota bacterium]
RLAQQIELGSGGIASGEVVELSASGSPGAAAAATGLPILLPSVAVRLAPKDTEAHELIARLCAGSPPVACREDSGGVLIDLRTVFPRQDSLLADVLAMGKAENTTG